MSAQAHTRLACFAFVLVPKSYLAFAFDCFLLRHMGVTSGHSACRTAIRIFGASKDMFRAVSFASAHVTDEFSILSLSLAVQVTEIVCGRAEESHAWQPGQEE